MEAKREKMEGMVLECGEEVKRSEGELVPVTEQLKEAEGRRKGVRRVGEGEVETLKEREMKLEMVERLDTEIRAYRDQGKDGQLLRLKGGEDGAGEETGRDEAAGRTA